VATAAEDRLSLQRNPHTSFAAASDCRTIAIYEYPPWRPASVGSVIAQVALVLAVFSLISATRCLETILLIVILTFVAGFVLDRLAMRRRFDAEKSKTKL